jgi:hypothetical protein
MSLTKVSYSMIQGAEVNALDYGAVPGGSAAINTPALQAAINYAATNGLILRIPAGTYTINANLTLPSKIGNSKFYVNIQGEGFETIILASGGVTKIFEFGITEVENLNFASISNLKLYGGQYGIYCPHLVHSSFSNLWIDSCTEVGFYFGSAFYGYCNYFENLNIMYCKVGMSANGAANQNHFNHCKFWLNQIGFAQAGGFANVHTNCLFESNTSTGIIIRGTAISLNGCYFELNGATGLTLTTPAITLHSDIIIDGGGDNYPFITSMSYSSPSQGISIKACSVASNGTTAGGYSFVYAYSGKGVEIAECVSIANSIPVLKTYQNAAYAGLSDINVSNNESFDSNIKFDNQTDGGQFASFDLKTILIKTINQISYADTDLINWGNGLGAFSGSWQRKNILDLNGLATPVFEIFYNNTASSGVKTFSVNAANYPNNIGKLFAFSIDYKVQTVGVVVSIYATANPGGGFTPGTTDWVTFTSYFLWPASGTLYFGVSKSTNVNSAYFANPILQEVGASYPNSIALIKPQITFRYTAAPTVGDWLLGDTVMNSAPASGQPAGWMCTVAGTPGTWRAMANLA